MAHIFSVEREHIIDAMADEIFEIGEFDTYEDALDFAFAEREFCGRYYQLVINEYNEEGDIIDSIIVR